MIVKSSSLTISKHWSYLSFFYLVNRTQNINLSCKVVILVEGYDLFLEIRVSLPTSPPLCIPLTRYPLIKVNNNSTIHLKKHLKNNRISGKLFLNYLPINTSPWFTHISLYMYKFFNFEPLKFCKQTSI